MKTFLLLLIVLFALESFAEPSRDTVIIKDLWQKKDTTKLKETLRENLPEDNEMKLLETNSSSPKNVKVRIVRNKNNTVTTVYSESDEEIRILGKNRFKRNNRSYNRYHRSFSGHWCGFNFGFVNFADADYSNYAASEDGFMDLDYMNSFVMQFNVFQQSINLVPRNNFGIVVGLGLEYQRLRFDNKKWTVTVNDDNILVPQEINPEWKVKKNSFKTLYLTIPLLMEVQFPALHRNKMYVSAGVMGGIRLHSKTKIVYNNSNGNKKKEKVSDDFNLLPVKADVVARIGYRGVNVWGSYTLTNMFKADKGPKLHPYSVGLGITF